MFMMMMMMMMMMIIMMKSGYVPTLQQTAESFVFPYVAECKPVI